MPFQSGCPNSSELVHRIDSMLIVLTFVLSCPHIGKSTIAAKRADRLAVTFSASKKDPLRSAPSKALGKAKKLGASHIFGNDYLHSHRSYQTPPKEKKPPSSI